MSMTSILRRFNAAALWLPLCLAATGMARAGCQTISGKVITRSDDGSSVSIRVSGMSPPQCVGGGSIVSVSVADAALKAMVKGAAREDGLELSLNSGGGSGAAPTLTDVKWLTLSDNRWAVEVMLIVLVALVLLTFLLARRVRCMLLIGEDGKYSNSKTQMTLWFGTVVLVYATAFILRAAGGYRDHLSIPMNLLALSGISGLTAAMAKNITMGKIDAAKKATGVNPKPTDETCSEASFPADLVKADNGAFDLGDYQMIVLTLLAATTYLYSAFHFLAALEQRVAVTLPDVDGTILGLAGIGQAAYLTKKAEGWGRIFSGAFSAPKPRRSSCRAEEAAWSDAAILTA